MLFLLQLLRFSKTLCLGVKSDCSEVGKAHWRLTKVYANTMIFTHTQSYLHDMGERWGILWTFSQYKLWFINSPLKISFKEENKVVMCFWMIFFCSVFSRFKCKKYRRSSDCRSSYLSTALPPSGLTLITTLSSQSADTSSKHLVRNNKDSFRFENGAVFGNSI